MSPFGLALFNQAIALAQSGRKAEAYQCLISLMQTNPNDQNVLLWLVFTAPNIQESEVILNRIPPTDSNFANARNWIAEEKKKQVEQRPIPKQKRQRTIAAIVGGAVLVILLVMVALTADSTPGAYTLTVNGVDRVYQYPVNPDTGIAVVPKNGYALMAIDVTLTSQSDKFVIADHLRILCSWSVFAYPNASTYVPAY